MSKIIEDEIDNWVYTHIGNDFVFRKHQKEQICSIIENIISSECVHNHIIEAPTGSGKSLIVIIAAGVLAEKYDIHSYILCSDLYLWDQYADFIKKHPTINFGMIKGQTGNYNCNVNNEDMRNADCRLGQVSWSSLFDPKKAAKLGYPCAARCEYVKARKRAIATPVTLTTYQMFLYQINIVAEGNTAASFQKRDVIFCDECHNIPDIVQCKMNPIIRHSDFDRMLAMYRSMYNKEHTLFDDDTSLTDDMNIDKLTDEFEEIFAAMCKDNTLGKDDVKLINRYNDLLSKFLPITNYVEDDIATRKALSLSASRADVDLFKHTSFFKNYMCVWNDFNTATNEAGIEYMIKEVHTDDEGDKYVTFNCTKEDWMVWNFLLSHANFRVMLSATVGGRSAFEENIGIKYTEDKTSKYEIIPSTFDYSKSPIFFLNRYKMSFREKEKSFEPIKDIVYNICNEFKDKKGIIQTGTYDIAKKLMFYAPFDIQKRMLLYDGSKMKSRMIHEHKLSDDTILVGPTLCEGVDLPDDNCRFIVIMKVPYPHLKDKLVQAKTKLFPLWYNSKTSTTIIQGIGRGVRNEHDYCTTYILDACFYNLYVNTKEQYPIELKERIKIFN